MSLTLQQQVTDLATMVMLLRDNAFNMGAQISFLNHQINNLDVYGAVNELEIALGLSLDAQTRKRLADALKPDVSDEAYARYLSQELPKMESGMDSIVSDAVTAAKTLQSQGLKV